MNRIDCLVAILIYLQCKKVVIAGEISERFEMVFEHCMAIFGPMRKLARAILLWMEILKLKLSWKLQYLFLRFLRVLGLEFLPSVKI
jgi:hypothetical protein